MNAMRLIPFLLGAVCWLGSLSALASDLSVKLQSANYVLLMRHALAPGVGDPARYTLEDCKTQRNLSDEGRQQARVIGQWLKQQGVQSADVQSSAWCRCKDTAELLNFQGFNVEPALGSFFDDMQKAQAQNLQLEKFIANKLSTKGKKALILVTHHVNIYQFVGENINSGDMVLAKVDASGRMTNYKLIPRPQRLE
jgi:phosphohistidine phosphatase SixA